GRDGRHAGAIDAAQDLVDCVCVEQWPAAILTLSLHDALPIFRYGDREAVLRRAPFGVKVKTAHDMRREFTILSALQGAFDKAPRSEEHTSELQSQSNLVCRLLLEKKNDKYHLDYPVLDGRAHS